MKLKTIREIFYTFSNLQNIGMAEFETGKPIEATTLFQCLFRYKNIYFPGNPAIGGGRKNKIIGLRLVLSEQSAIYQGNKNFAAALPHFRISQSDPAPVGAPAGRGSRHLITKVLYATSSKKHAKLKNNPGEKFSYSNLNYLPLGQILEKVSGLSYREYIRQHIL